MATEQVSKTGEFFPVSIQALDQIAAQGGTAGEVLGYLVLARHATGNRLDWGRLTSAGACAVQKKAGLTRRSAEAALEWLRDNRATLADGKSARFIAKAEDAREQFGAEQVPEHLGYGKNSSRRTKVRWCLPQFDNPIYLPNALIDGIGKGNENPPLSRIYNDVHASGVGAAASRHAGTSIPQPVSRSLMPIPPCWLVRLRNVSRNDLADCVYARRSRKSGNPVTFIGTESST